MFKLSDVTQMPGLQTPNALTPGQTSLLRMLSAAGPWRALAGSYLDLEELLLVLGLPTSADGWSKLTSRAEHRLGEALGTVYGSLARLAFNRSGLTNEAAVQVGPLFFNTKFGNNVPLQIGIAGTRPMLGATQVVVAGTHDYSGQINGTHAIDGVDIEVGFHRVVMRHDWFRARVSVTTALSRYGVPWVDGITVMPKGPVATLTGVTGTFLDGETVSYTGGSAEVVRLVSGSLYLRQVTGTPAGAITSASGGAATVSAYSATADLLTAAATITPFANLALHNPAGGMYPNFPVASYFTPLLAALPVFSPLVAGLQRGAYNIGALRVDQAPPVADMLYALAAYVESLAQGHFTAVGSVVSFSNLTDGSLTAQLRALNLPA